MAEFVIDKHYYTSPNQQEPPTISLDHSKELPDDALSFQLRGRERFCRQIIAIFCAFFVVDHPKVSVICSASPNPSQFGHSKCHLTSAFCRPFSRTRCYGRLQRRHFCIRSTASGKTYTQSGHSAGEEPGIIPRAMKDVFLLFASQKKENIFYHVPIFENL